jgi:hypothetical protein
MKALSVRQPWAFLIVYGGKDIENRTRMTSYRGRLLIHASQKVDREAIEYFGLDPALLLRGAVIGVADLVDVVAASESAWFFGPWGWVLEGARPLTAVPMLGALGLFEVDDSLVRIPRRVGSSPSRGPQADRRTQTRRLI